MEVLIVIAIVLILTSGVGFMAFRYIGKSRLVAARSQVDTLALALDAYAFDCLCYPSTEQGLDALWARPDSEPVPAGWDGPYVTKKPVKDPWGHPYVYAAPGPSGLPFGIRSLGADGRDGGEGGDADVSSWEE